MSKSDGKVYVVRSWKQYQEVEVFSPKDYHKANVLGWELAGDGTLIINVTENGGLERPAAVYPSGEWVRVSDTIPKIKDVL